MHNRIVLPLVSKTNFFYNEDKLRELKKELEEFLNDRSNAYMNAKSFAERFMGCQEIKSNNSVEGYNDDISTIIKVIGNHHENHLSKNRKQAICNLYRGYKEILTTPDINKETLQHLYKILSNGLLSSDDLNNMGEYYRMAPVYIFYSRNLTAQPAEGIDYSQVEECMDSLFEYLNEDQSLSPTDHFIKSQIAHYYFVHVHPYFDVNGRTARTLGMWYLLNNRVYPYIIFNRAIPFTIQKYYKIIRDVNKFKNMTFFLNYMLKNAKIELEKEHIISMINESVKGGLSENEYQILLYILTMKGVKTCKDYATLYNRFNETKKVLDIRDEMLIPLIDREILKVVKSTGTGFDDGTSNFVFELNPKHIENDPKKIKRLTL